MFKDGKCPYHPNCDCLDYCEFDDPYSTPEFKCRGCGDNCIEHNIKGLCYKCAEETYKDE